MAVTFSDNRLTFVADIYYTRVATEAINKEIEDAIKRAVIDELAKSDEFQQAIRNLAVKRIIHLIEREDNGNGRP